MDCFSPDRYASTVAAESHSCVPQNDFLKQWWDEQITLLKEYKEYAIIAVDSFKLWTIQLGQGVCKKWDEWVAFLVYLQLLFNIWLSYDFVRLAGKWIIIPLPINVAGDNYCGITSSPSKLFKSVLMNLYAEYFSSDHWQLVFKCNSSCSNVIFTLTTFNWAL